MNDSKCLMCDNTHNRYTYIFIWKYSQTHTHIHTHAIKYISTFTLNNRPRWAHLHTITDTLENQNNSEWKNKGTEKEKLCSLPRYLNTLFLKSYRSVLKYNNS